MNSTRRVGAHNGNEMSENDTQTYHRTLILTCMVMCDAAEVYMKEDMNQGTLIRWAKECASYDVMTFGQVLKEYTVFILNISVQNSTQSSYEQFQAALQLRFNNIDCKIVISPVKKWLYQHLDQPNVNAFKLVYQFLAFPGRLTLRDISLESECIYKFYECEEAVRNTTVSTTTTEELQRWFAFFVGDFQYDNFIPSHGNGAVAERHLVHNSIYEKYQCLSYTQLQLYALKRIGQDNHFDPEQLTPLTRNKHKKVYVSKLTTVPKNLLTKRVITMEPATNMYLQKGMLRAIQRHILSHKFLKHVIPLKTPEINVERAREGSITGQIATVDMSDASDTISYKLIKDCVRHTVWRYPFIGFRTSWVSIPKRGNHKLWKNAPMGSALCFVTMCLLLSAICCIAITRSGHTPKISDFTVYGDDVTIDVTYLKEFFDVCAECGFKINHMKTFTKGNFRESCGGEFLCGVDVTPLRIPRKYSTDALMWYDFHNDTINGEKCFSHELISNYIDLANACYDKRYYITRGFLLDEIMSNTDVKHHPIFSEDGCSGIKSLKATNYHLRRSSSKRYQCDVLHHGGVGPVEPQSEDFISDRINYAPIAYWQWHTQCHARLPFRHTDILEDTGTIRISRSESNWIQKATLL